MLAGSEFVADKDTKRPYPRELKFAETFVDAALEEGLVLWPNIGHADGENGDLVMIAPPFIITDDEIGELVKRFKTALGKTLDHISVSGGKK
jgi:adenosylmethionine-8-amino-7-oxononanoate aminotransferase